MPTDREQNEINDDIEISLFVKSLQTGLKLPSDLDDKKEYGDYLVEKYK